MVNTDNMVLRRRIPTKVVCEIRSEIRSAMLILSRSRVLLISVLLVYVVAIANITVAKS